MTIEKLLCDLLVLVLLIGAAAYIVESTKYLDERKQK
jgi:hypothetical protein